MHTLEEDLAGPVYFSRFGLEELVDFLAETRFGVQNCEAPNESIVLRCIAAGALF
jgi:hypothetical protein